MLKVVSLNPSTRIDIFTFICCKNCNDDCLKRPKINDKRGRCWPIIKKNILIWPWWWSNGQCACLLLRRSEFESHSVFSFYSLQLFEKNKKEARDGPYKNTI